jgi:hypothetical protein
MEQSRQGTDPDTSGRTRELEHCLPPTICYHTFCQLADSRVAPGSDSDPCRGTIRQQLARFARTRGVTLVDLQPVIGRHMSRAGAIRSGLYAANGHPNARGYKRIAARVYRALVESGGVTVQAGQK